MKLKNKFLLILFSLIFLVAISGGLLATWTQRESVKEEARLEGKKVASLARTILESKLKSLVESAEIASGDAVFRGQVGKTLQTDSDFGIGENPDQIETSNIDKVHEVLKSSAMTVFKKYELLVILTEKGQVLYSKNNPTIFGQNLSELNFFKTILADRPQMSIWSNEDGSINSSKIFQNSLASNEYFLIQVSPIMGGRDILGFLIAGAPVVDGFLKELKSVSQLDVGIKLKNKNVLITDSNSKEKFNAMFTKSDSTYLNEELTIDGLSMDLVLAYPLEEKVNKFTRHFLVGFSLAMIVVLVLVFWLGTELTNSISKPLEKLSQAAQEVASGNLNIRIEVNSNDEIGDLGKTFNDMIDNLSTIRMDPLTGLFTESYLRDTLTHHLLTKFSGNKKTLIVIIGLKNIQELHQKGGLLAVNEILIELSGFISKKITRENDLLVRTEDHSLIYYSANGSDVFVRQMTQALIEHFGDKLRIGLGAVLTNQHVHTSEDYLNAANEALAISKNSLETNCVFSKGSV